MTLGQLVLIAALWLGLNLAFALWRLVVAKRRELHEVSEEQEPIRDAWTDQLADELRRSA